MSFDKTKKVILQLLSCSLFQKPFFVEDDINWKDVLWECKLQSVVSLAYSSLPKEQIPEEDLIEWKKSFNLELMQNSKVSYAHSMINNLLVKSEISYVTLKGCVSAYYYDNPMLRTMGDVDFLVRKKDFEKVNILLMKYDFIPHNIKHEYEKAYSKENVTFELHKKINGITNRKELNEVLSEIRDRFGMTNQSLEIYAHEKYVEKLLMVTMLKVIQNDNLKVVLKLKKEVFESLSVEKLFYESTKITTKFNFQYKNGSILITLLKASLDKNYILYIEELLEVIYNMKFKV